MEHKTTAYTQIDAFLVHLINKSKSPSIQYHLFDENQIIHTFQKGFADIKNQIEVTDQTTYNIFSVTKTFTALAIMQLVEKGKIHLDEFAINYLPSFPYPSNITIRQLLSHTSGVPNPIPLKWIHLLEEHPTFNQQEFFKPVFIKHPRVKFHPNEKFAYSNLGYVLLGQIIESITGLKYEEYIDDRIISMLNLKPYAMSFQINQEDRHATGYHKAGSFLNWMLGFFINPSEYRKPREGKWQPFKNFYINGTSYGGLICTPIALVEYLQVFLKPENLLFNQSSKAILFSENFTNNQKATGMCLGWFKGILKDQVYYYHPGGGGGYYVEVRIYPDLGIGSVIFLNRSGLKDERLLDSVDHFFLANS